MSDTQPVNRRKGATRHGNQLRCVRTLSNSLTRWFSLNDTTVIRKRKKKVAWMLYGINFEAKENDQFPSF
jgi:hypothetical protein